MTTIRTLASTLALATLVALALPPPAARAGYGNGGGGGGKQQPDLPANVKVKVKNGDLVMTGSSGTIQIAVFKTLDGLRIQGGGDTTINGGTEPFETSAEIGHWKMRFGRSRASEVHMSSITNAPVVPRIERISFAGGLRAELELDTVEVLGDVKIDMRRSLFDKQARVTLIDSTVGGDVKMSATSHDAALYVIETEIGGTVRMNVRARKRSQPAGHSAELVLAYSEVGAVSSDIRVAGTTISIRNVTARGDCTFVGDHHLRVQDSHVGGDLVLKANIWVQRIDLQRSVIDGATTFVLGRDEDRFAAEDCTFRVLDVRSGAGDDDVLTTGSTCAAGSVLDGQRGKGDTWSTSDPDMLEARGIETIELIPAE